VSNLKQVALAARIYYNDHGDKFPPDFLSMSNELTTPLILVCPSDKGHTKAQNWDGFSTSNVSYEFLLPSADEKKLAPETPVFQCPIHGSTAMGDGSVRTSLRRNRSN